MYRYTFMSLTSSLQPGGSAKAFFDERLNGHRRIQQRWRAAIGVMQVPHISDCTAPNLGLAADHLLVGVASGSLGWGVGGYDTACAVNVRLADDLQRIVEGPVEDLDTAARASWYCGLLDSVGRGFRPKSDSALVPFRHAQSLREAFERVPAGVVEELLTLLSANQDVLNVIPTPRRKGPAFSSSGLVDGADCDLLAASTVIELKTVSGHGLDRDYVRQLVGYVLLDTHDEFALSHVTLWYTRHAFSTTWEIDELLEELSGRSLRSVADWRADFAEHLSTWRAASGPTLARRRKIARGEQLRLFELSGSR